MNKEQIRKYQIFSVILTFILGTLLHFTYKWSGEDKIVAIFSAVNESTWEHLKLLYFPMLISTIIGYLFIGKQIPNFLCSKIIGILVAIGFTIVFFYTYAGVLGKNVAIINILSFFIAAILGEFTSYALMVNSFKCKNNIYAIILIVIFISFMMFTFHTPKIGLFKDPVNENYGITD